MLQINSEFQTFKHIECLAPGELMRAHRALEATVAIHPTLVLTNALPYDMDVVVWQVNPRYTLNICSTSAVTAASLDIALTKYHRT